MGSNGMAAEAAAKNRYIRKRGSCFGSYHVPITTRVVAKQVNSSVRRLLKSDAMPNGSLNTSTVSEADLSEYDLSEDDLLPGDLQPKIKITLIAIYVLIITLALFSNLTALVVIALNRELHTVTNIFIASLEFSDILIAGVNMPITLASHIQLEYVDQNSFNSIQYRR